MATKRRSEPPAGAWRFPSAQAECRVTPRRTRALGVGQDKGHVQAQGVPLVRPSMPELDVLRGFAILMVFVYHAWYWSFEDKGMPLPGSMHVLSEITRGGWLGVHLFFVLSGFLITGLLLATRARADYFKRFYVRRVLRIFPVYFATLVILLMTGKADLPFVALAAFFLGNVTNLFGVPTQYGPLWSLAVEEHFYLLWPLLVRRVSLPGLFIITSSGIVGAPLLRVWAYLHGWTAGLYTYTWFTFDGLMIGALLALLLRPGGLSRHRALWLGSGLVSVFAVMIVIGRPFGILSRRTPLGAALQYSPWCLLFAGVLVLALYFGSEDRFRPLLRNRSLIFFGDISYGLYLIHLLIFWSYDRVIPAPTVAALGPTVSPLMRFAVAGGCSVLLAVLSRRYFEAPFLRMKRALAP